MSANEDMTDIQELRQVMETLRKFNLPVSPILECAVKERIEQCGIVDGGTVSVCETEPSYDVRKSLNDYVHEFANLSVATVNGKRTPHKAILLLSIIKLIEDDVISENKVDLDKTIVDAFAVTWRKYCGEAKLPSVWIPFWYLKRESFWHFKPKADNDGILEGLVKFAGHPSVGQMRPVISYAYFDDALFGYLTAGESRGQLRDVLVREYITL